MLICTPLSFTQQNSNRKGTEALLWLLEQKHSRKRALKFHPQEVVAEVGLGYALPLLIWCSPSPRWFAYSTSPRGRLQLLPPVLAEPLRRPGWSLQNSGPILGGLYKYSDRDK
jgi:hypothetical protein